MVDYSLACVAVPQCGRHILANKPRLSVYTGTVSRFKLVRISTCSKLSGLLLVTDFYVRDFGMDTFAQK